MEYRKFGDTYIVRMDRDEEILAQLKIFAEKEQVKLASVTALGAVKDFTIGVFDTCCQGLSRPTAFRESMKSSPWWAPSTPRTGTFTATSTCAPVTRRAAPSAGI